MAYVSQPPVFSPSVSPSGSRQVPGYKILVEDVPSFFTLGLIAAWIARANCPAPRDLGRVETSPSGRNKICLTFDRADQAVAAMHLLSGCDLEEGAFPTRTSLWEASSA